MLTYEDFHQHLVDQFDMQDFKDAIGPGYSDEMLLYPLFYRQLVSRRIGDFNRLWDISEFKEFPVGSIVHLLDDNFLMNKPIVFVPDVNSWTMTRDPYRKFILHISEPPAETWVKNIEKFVLDKFVIQWFSLLWKIRCCQIRVFYFCLFCNFLRAYIALALLL